MSQGKTADMLGSASTSSTADEHQDSIEQLFQKHHRTLLNFLRRRFTAQEAREAAQEAFSRLLSIDSKSIRSLPGFLFRSASNIAVDRRRHAISQDRVREELPVLFFSEMADVLSPERRVSGEQELQQVQRAIDEMPPKCQQAFIMHQIEGVDFPEIAAQMQLSESMVRKYVSKGLLHCRARLRAEKEPSHEK